MPGEKIPLLARVAGGRVLGPRPGMAIVSFWQGIVEIVLRAVALVSGTSCFRYYFAALLSRINCLCATRGLVLSSGVCRSVQEFNINSPVCQLVPVH